MQASRRDFLKLAALLSGAAGMAGAIPASIQKALAIEPEPGSTYLDAEHIVILMQENRSFDHALGTLQGVRGFNDPRAIRHANGDSIFVQRDASGNAYAPWRLDIKNTRATWMSSLPHTRESQVDAWNEGRHDGWIEAKRSGEHEYAGMPLTMGHYTRDDIPFYYALADAFTVCDQSYCSVMTSTSPNRSVFWSGTVRDEQKAGSRVYMRNDELLTGGMPWKTYPERLQEAGISWKFYQNELTHSPLTGEQDAWLGNFGCNMLEYFSAYNIEAYPGGGDYMQRKLDQAINRRAKREYDLLQEKDADERKFLRTNIALDQQQIKDYRAWLARGGEARFRELTPEQRALHEAAFVTNTNDPHYHALQALSFEDAGKAQQMNVPAGDILHQFRKDVQEGKLPTVSWVTPPEKFSDHPTSPWYGAWYLSEVIDILSSNPEVWKKTIFILTYDENDGYFDHAPSYVAADPKRPHTGGASTGIYTGLEYTYREDELVQGVHPDNARTGPIGLGYRIPTIVASPWSRGGWVNSQLTDHTSTLMFLEDFLRHKFGKEVRETNISPWRRAICSDLSACFRPQTSEDHRLEFVKRDPFVISIQKARTKEVPSNYRKLTAAEILEITNNPRIAQATVAQEPGIRPSSALPYELYADGAMNAAQSAFELHLKAGDRVHGPRTSGAPFNVYVRGAGKDGKPSMRVATYVVKPGDTLTEKIPLSMSHGGQFVIDVHAPNGFFRSFQGRVNHMGVKPRLAYEWIGSKLTGNVEVHLHNAGKAPLVVSVSDNAYKTGMATRRTLEPGEESVALVPTEKSHGWYDLSVITEGLPDESRFAGRVETGAPSFTDPLMGGVV